MSINLYSPRWQNVIVRS